MSYILPQVRVFQEYRESAEVLTEPLRAFIFGPHFKLFRYSVADEQINIGEYTGDEEIVSAWVNKPADSTVDAGYTKIFIDDALLRYFRDAVGSGSTIKNPGRKNAIRSDTVVFKTGNDVDRSDVLGSRDVQVGDVARITGTHGVDEVLLETTVTGFLAEVIASSMDATATADAANDATVSATSSVTLTNDGGDPGTDITATSDETNYDGLADGQTSETYIITVTQGSTGGVASTARLSVRSASGTDDADDVTPADWGDPTDIGSNGLTVTFDNTSDDFLEGQEWTAEVSMTYDEPVLTTGGEYTGSSDTTYILRCTRGGASGTCEVTVTTTTGVDYGVAKTVTFDEPFSVGANGITVTFASSEDLLSYGDTWYIGATAETDGGFQTLLLADDIPETLRLHTDEGSSSSEDPSDVMLELFIKKNIQVPEADDLQSNWEQDETDGVTLYTGVSSYDSAWYDDDGDLVAMPVMGGTVYLEYRALLTTYSDVVGDAYDIEDAEELVGPCDTTDNPLGYAVYKACQNSNSTIVKFAGVPTDDLAGYTAVVDKVVGRKDVYGFVPLTKDATIQAMVKTHVLAVSTPEKARWRRAFLNSEANLVAAISTGLLGTVEADDDGNFTILTAAADGDFLEVGVQPGDILRINYSVDMLGNDTYEEYVVDEVRSNSTLILRTGLDAAVTTATRFEVHRNRSGRDVATAYAVLSAGFNDARVSHVWPDVITSDAGVVVEGYHLCAAIAGLLSGITPQQNMTNIEVAGFSAVPHSTELMGDDDLNVMAEDGTLIVTQDPETYTIYIRHSLTTDMSRLEKRELGMCKNLDSISYVFHSRVAPYIGLANITPTFLALLRREIQETIDFLKSNNFAARTGGQIVDAQIAELRQHAQFLDRVVAVVDATLPPPFNNADIHIVV